MKKTIQENNIGIIYSYNNTGLAVNVFDITVKQKGTLAT